MTIEERKALVGREVVLFDGVCGFCHRVVRFLMARDRQRRLVYVPLESRLGGEVLGMDGLAGWVPDSVVLVEAALTPEQTVSVQSEAVSRMLCVLGGGWGVVGKVSQSIPRGVRDAAYGLVARWRYRLFGRYAVCPLPTAKERGSILGD